MQTTDIQIEPDIGKVVQFQRHFFNSGKTLSVDFRIEQLKKLRKCIVDHEELILDALNKDLNKSSFEAYATEVGFTLSEIDFTIKKIKKWAKPRKVHTPFLHAIASSRIYPEPYGICLIIAPWNYPFQLIMAPLIGAMAAGNCCVLKPSELAENTAATVNKIVSENFEPEYIKVIEGGIETSQELLEQKFDYIFFTGGTEVGRIVYQAAAKHLTPVTLELGGKSPCIIDQDIHLEYAAKRIAWGKFINAGQTCVAPDYLLIHKNIKERFLTEFKTQVESFYGKQPAECSYYPKIINRNHFNRLVDYLQNGNVIFGGENDAEKLFIAPTLLEGVSENDKVMKEEIFGPILPVITYDDLEEAIQIAKKNPNPLSLYVFSKNKKVVKKVLDSIPAGGGCVNDTLIHLGTPYLPFGGTGSSGIGAYHGKSSFDTFSHMKGFLHRSNLIDLDIRYAPYKDNKIPALKWLMKKFL